MSYIYNYQLSRLFDDDSELSITSKLQKTNFTESKLRAFNPDNKDIDDKYIDRMAFSFLIPIHHIERIGGMITQVNVLYSRFKNSSRLDYEIVDIDRNGCWVGDNYMYHSTTINKLTHLNKYNIYINSNQNIFAIDRLAEKKTKSIIDNIDLSMVKRCFEKQHQHMKATLIGKDTHIRLNNMIITLMTTPFPFDSQLIYYDKETIRTDKEKSSIMS